MSVEMDSVDVRRGRVAAVVEHSAFRYVVIGVLSAGIDFGLLYALHGGLGVPVGIAAFIAVTLAFFCNFALNRIWSFRSQAPVVGQFGKYLFLGCVNWVLTAILVTAFTALGLNYLVAKAIALVLTTGSNYLLYRVWVFKDRRPATSPGPLNGL
ncbi:GtrA family protein [Dactylosporangium aurantiacum]|uniref:GtrA family protein n=1 Tax=Dactylosporangium aurantiacum TaxID=35754 RepID=A0A9Q9MG20_9ACTN|nr:GtrA family protein [Dactylosporangium aurantiacum]MDG6100852.1 GtrA family protein [Dactylosporangium aurantiacum]UWZ55089.1 GtrA family protein [Dactylosporangium aurantiacum]